MYLAYTVPQPEGDPEFIKRGPNFEQKGDPNDVKGDCSQRGCMLKQDHLR